MAWQFRFCFSEIFTNWELLFCIKIALLTCVEASNDLNTDKRVMTATTTPTYYLQKNNEIQENKITYVFTRGEKLACSNLKDHHNRLKFNAQSLRN